MKSCKNFPALKNASVIPLICIITLLSSCKKDLVSSTAPTTLQDNAVQSVAVPELTKSIGDGVNLQPSYYNGGNPNFGWSLMKTKTNIKTVRIEIEPGYVTQGKNWIQQAVSNGYQVIATYHKASQLGSANRQDLIDAANWWKTNYATLKQGGSFTMNLSNEWGAGTMSSNNFASYYNDAIAIVRQVYSGAIIIDCAGYGHETNITAQAVKGTNGTKITDGNIILSMHIYPNGYSNSLNHYTQNSDLDLLSATGKPCIVGEFGNSPSGSANWSGLVDYAKSKGWTVLAWAWNGDGGSMNMVTPSWASNGSATSFSLSSYFNTVYPKL